MINRTKSILAGNIESILRPYKGRNVVSGVVDPEDRRVHLTPTDLATILILGFEERGFSLTIKKKISEYS